MDFYQQTLPMKKIYKLGTVGMFNILNSPLQELPGPSPSMVLIIFVLKIPILCMVVDEPQKIVP